MRSEFDAIEDAFDLFPAFSGNALLPLRVNAGETAIEAATLTGAYDLAGGRLTIDDDDDSYDEEISDDTIGRYAGGSLVHQWTADGNTQPLQPAFLVGNAARTNITGNTTTYTLLWDGTEHFDQGTDVASNTFTASVTGKYLLSVMVDVSGITTAADILELAIITSNRTYTLRKDIAANWDADREVVTFTLVADMDAADTATVTLKGTGEAGDVWDLGANNTFFSGCLLA